jgi:alanine racemase
VYKFFDNDLIASVFTKEHLNILLKEKKRLKIKNQIIVHIKVDTGMNRLGIDFKTASNFVEMLSKKSDFKIDGIFTHFATSDIVNNDYTKLQIKRFDEVLKSLQKKNVNYGLAHAANSGAILDFPESYYDMVRPGIALYGYFPSQQTSESIKLYPVMSVISKVSTISEIETGETVSYGRRFKAKAKIKIISVPIGYADGFNRALTNKAKAIIKGKFYNQIGTVTMDRIMFDVNNDNINVNDKVVLLGKNGKLKIDAWDWSNLINTIPYEITCGISKRVPRVIKQ